MESVKHENNVQNGFAYLEHWSSEITQSKAGQQMAKIKWSAVDRFGNIGSVYDYVGSSEKTQFKANNLDNALGSKDISIYDPLRNQFNLHLLRKSRCCAVIERDEYGPKIKKYVPMEFCNLISSQKDDVSNDNRIAISTGNGLTDSIDIETQKFANGHQIGGSKYNAPFSSGSEHMVMSSDDDDDIPF